MSISYTEALSIVHTVAQAKKCKTTAEEGVQLAAALGRRASRDVRSPVNTPMFDSSAMDGYAVSSALTSNASATNALELRVEGTIAAGDPPPHLPCNVDGQGRIACVEIMTGAPFPQSSFGPEFDACIPWEHTHALPSTCDQMKMIKLTRPPKHNQHRRFAGHDFRRADMIVKKGDEIGPHHIMAMASVGLETVYVHECIQVTVITTGSELQEPRLLISDVMPSKLPDCNGPFLRASLRTFGIQMNAITGVSDAIEELRTQFVNAVSSQYCDVLITTGGVSAGKFDFVPEAIMQLGGSVHFQGVAMRPGHPVLFASLPTDIRDGTTGDVPLFGLPGNPIATAACYRFLVVPYLRAFFGQTSEVPLCDMKISAAADDVRNDEIVYRKDKKLDVFRHGQMCGDKVALSNEQSPGKVKPFACANCWVHLGVGISEVRPGDKANCYPLHSSTCFTVG